MTKRLTKYHVAHILALIVLIVLGVFFSPNVTALSDSKTYSMSAVTNELLETKIDLRIATFKKYSVHEIAYMRHQIRNIVSNYQIISYEGMCQEIAKHMFLLGVPLLEITITVTDNVPTLGWKSKSCLVSHTVSVIIRL